MVKSSRFSSATKPKKERSFQNSRTHNTTGVFRDINEMLDNAKLSNGNKQGTEVDVKIKPEESDANINSKTNNTSETQIEVEQKDAHLQNEGTKIILLSETAIDVTKKKLEEFEMKQKLIKEQNEKRKEMLSKALADRTKKTTEEVKRLKEIKGEFKKLDQLLSNDVSLLRLEIEVACVEFMEAQYVLLFLLVDY